MSVIHEALKRAERERSAGLIPQAAVAVTAPAAPSRRLRHGAVAVLGAAVLLLLGLSWSRHRVPPPERSSAPGAITTLLSPAPSALDRSAGASPPAAAVTASAPPEPDAAAEPASLNARAVAAFREGRTEASRRLLERALHLAPAMPEAHNNLGMVLQAGGDRAAARKEFLRALALRPGYPEALNNLGLCLSEEGHQREALESFEQALRSRPGYGAAHLNIAITFDKLGRRVEALAHYRKFLENAAADEKDLVGRVNERLRR